VLSTDVAKPRERASVIALHDAFSDRAHARGTEPAILAPGRIPLTYGRLLSSIETTVRTLRALGVQRNDRVAIVSPNGPEMAVAFLGVAAGAACAPLNPAFRGAEFEFYLADLDARALLIQADMPSAARQVARERRIPLIEMRPEKGDGAGVFSLSIDAPGRSAPIDFAEPEDVALVLHTSGTTSRPKMVPLTHTNVWSSAGHIAATLGLDTNDRCLNVMPLFHIHGLIGAVMSSLAAGGTVICTPGFSADQFFQWIDALEPTWYTAVPTMHQAVLAEAARQKERVGRRLRFIRSSSAPLPRRVLTDLESVFGTAVIESYGMTEACHQMTSNPMPPRARKPGSVGIAAGPEVAIMNDVGDLLPSGEVGEVVIRGPNVTSGYAQRRDSNQTMFTGGWFRTGDQGRFDSDGYLFLTGRLKEMINRGGEKIAPREVDEVLCQHSAVAHAVAFAMPHPTLGEDVAAAVVLRENVEATEREIVEFAAAQMAPFKVPQQVLIVDEIPKGPTGKLERIGLADRFAPQLAARRAANFVAPETEIETELSKLWKELLKVEHVGLRDTFYALGGDSLAIATMIAEVEARFDAKVPLARFLKSPTIETLALLVLDTRSVNHGDRERHRPAGHQTARVRDTMLRGLKNRILQVLALHAPGYRSTRVWLHRMRGVSIGNNVSIGLSTLIETAYPSLVSIGNNVTLGMRVSIIAHLRDLTSEARRSQDQHTVRIEDDAYIGPGVVILPNVTIGRGAVVSAGSVVSRSLPPRTLSRGNPAVPIAHCSVSLGGGTSYEDFVRGLKPIKDEVL
jgi:acyl-CoA synthetase (AMP-forming)/AMP-acid ligase II/acetyltransferase-like isoleucine patch superfamily enzyme/acyl carrier protein